MMIKEKVYRVLPKRRPKSKLIKSQAFPTGLENPGPRCLRKPQSRHLERRNIVNSLIVGHSPNDHSNLIILVDLKSIRPIANHESRNLYREEEAKKGPTFPFMKVMSLLREIGGLLVLLIKSLLSITALNLLPVDIVGPRGTAPRLLAPAAGDEIDTLKWTKERESRMREQGRTRVKNRERVFEVRSPLPLAVPLLLLAALRF
ncbi:hypothetical protein GW17_00026148 [Ensete ventricosum]|nr:hypothetical protein GW17_00026148 [Ensete ventricosum]